jgi:hypothetical protein
MSILPDIKTTTRFPNGISTDILGGNLGDSVLPDPSKMHTYFNDFDYYDDNNWEFEVVGTPSRALIDADGGVFRAQTSNAPGDETSQLLKGQSFRFVSGKNFVFKTKMSITTLNGGSYLLGLSTDNSPFATIRDAAVFSMFEGDIDFVLSKDNSRTIVNVGTYEANEFLTLGYQYNSKGNMSVYINDEVVANVVTNNLPDDVDLSPFISAVKSSTPVPKAIDVDYLYVASER